MYIKNEKALNKAIDEIISTNLININVADMLMTAFSYVDAVNQDKVKELLNEGFSMNEAICEG